MEKSEKGNPCKYLVYAVSQLCLETGLKTDVSYGVSQNQAMNLSLINFGGMV